MHHSLYVWPGGYPFFRPHFHNQNLHGGCPDALTSDWVGLRCAPSPLYTYYCFFGILALLFIYFYLFASFPDYKFPWGKDCICFAQGLYCIALYILNAWHK